MFEGHPRLDTKFSFDVGVIHPRLYPFIEVLCSRRIAGFANVIHIAPEF